MCRMTALENDPRFIPTSVRAAVSIRNATEDPQISEHDIERMVRAEPMVAAALLRMANSAAFRVGEATADIGQAVFALGLAQVRSIASHVAMLQLVHGIRPRAARAAAEALLLHSISVSAFAEQLARQEGYPEGPRLASLGLFHEVSMFLFLAQANRVPEEFEAIADAKARLKRVPLRSYELIMQDLGLPELAVPTLAESALVDRAHAFVAHANPLTAHPAEGGDRSALSGELVLITQARADAAYVSLVEGAVARTHGSDDGRNALAEQHPDFAGTLSPAPAEAARSVGIIAALGRFWGGLFK